MGRYFSVVNFKEAARLGGLMTLLSLPRVLTDGVLPPYFILFTLLWLVMLAAAVTAWGRCAGMAAYFPSGKRVVKGLLWALLLVVLSFPVKVYWFNPLLLGALEMTGNEKAVGLVFPATLISGAELTLWVMSFEVLFFQAATLSFFAKLLKSFYPALFFTAIFRALVTLLKLRELGVESGEAVILFHAIIVNVVSCLLFSRFGLPASMLFIGGISLYRWRFFF